MSKDFPVRFEPATGALAGLKYLRVAVAGKILHIALARPGKRNAVNEAMLQEIQTCILNLPRETRVAIITGDGEHFCAGLDLTEVVVRDSLESIEYSRRGHKFFDDIQYGRIPVIAVLQGAVVGAGLELAASCHLRVAQRSAYFGLPEGQRGIFVGGSGSVRIPPLLGLSRMTDMMLTGRVFNADEVTQAGLVNYLVEEGQGWSKALALAGRIAENLPTSNYAITSGLPRIAEQGYAAGLYTETLLSTIAQQAPETQSRLADFMQKGAGKVMPPSGAGA